MIVGYRGIGGIIGFASTLLIGRWDPRLGMGIGFTLAITLIGAIRELIGNGSLFGLQVFGVVVEQIPEGRLAP